MRTLLARLTWADAGVALILLLLFLVRLSGAPLFDVDEGAFAQASREMLASGDWGHTTLNGNDRFDKPIFIYWWQAALMALLGPHDWVARLPSALAVLAACAGVWRFATLQWGAEAGRRAAFMLGTSLGLLAMGRAATADGMLNALLIATGLSLYTFASTGSSSALRWAYVWCALGLLTKGPVAVVVPGAALALWSVFSDRGRTLLRAAWEPKGWLLLLAIALPWYVYAWQRHGMAFVDGFFLKHNVERFTGTLEGHGGNALYYVLVLPLLVLPWTPWFARVLGSVHAHFRDPLKRFLWLWMLFVLGFFSLSGTKLPHYMLYGVAPLVLLMASQSVQAPESRGWNSALWVSVLLLCALAGALPALVSWGAPQVQDLWVQSLLLSAPSGRGLVGSAWVTGLVVLLLWLWKGPQSWHRIMGSVSLASLLWVTMAIPWLGQVLQNPFQQVALWSKQNAPEVQVVQWRMHQPSLAFYRGQPMPGRLPQAGEWVVVRHDRTQGLPMNDFETVYSHRGLSLMKPVRP